MINKILVIDDEPSALRFAQYTLEQADYRVITAQDGTAGLTAAQAEIPDLILLDVAMPGMGGFEVLRRIRAEPAIQNIPVVMLTALSAEKGESIGLDLGVQHYIPKPCDPEELALNVRVALRTHDQGDTRDRRLTFRLGNPVLDNELGGGIPVGSLALIEGTSASGKSVLCQHFAYAALAARRRVAYFTFENSVESLVNQMRSIGLEVSEYANSEKLLIRALGELDETSEDDESISFASLGKEIEHLPEHYKLVVVDALTHLTASDEEKDIMNFFRTCKRVATRGKTFLLVIHATSFEEKMLIRLRSLCDANLRLSVEKFGQKLLKTMEVCKIQSAELDTGKVVNFDVKPGIGIQISPMTRTTI